MSYNGDTMLALEHGCPTRCKSGELTLRHFTQGLPNWLAEMQITNLDVSFCKACKIDVVSQMTSLQVLSLQVNNPCLCVLRRTSPATGVCPYVHAATCWDGMALRCRLQGLVVESPQNFPVCV